MSAASPVASIAQSRPDFGLRPQFVLARPKTDKERAEPWGVEYPMKFFAGFDSAGRIMTRDSLCRGVEFFYASPLLAKTRAILERRGFRVKRLLVVDAEDVFDPYTRTHL